MVPKTSFIRDKGDIGGRHSVGGWSRTAERTLSHQVGWPGPASPKAKSNGSMEDLLPAWDTPEKMRSCLESRSSRQYFSLLTT